MPDPAPTPADDAFARRLFHRDFRNLVRRASKPVFPAVLLPERRDILQEALVRAYEHRAQFRGRTDDDLLGWVLVIVKNLTRDILKARRSRPVPEPVSQEELEERAVGPPSVEAEDVELPPRTREQVERLEGILGGLSDADREILLLRDGKHLTFPEISDLLSTPGKPLSEDAAKMRYFRALKRFKEIAERAQGHGGAPGRPPPHRSRPASEEE